jgi:DNA ligase-1
VRRLASALDRARACRSRTGKEEAIAAALRSIAEDGDDVALATAARMAAGRVLPVGDGRSLGVGWSVVLDVVRAATGHDDEVIFACSRKTGDLGEAFGLLLRRVEGSEQREGLPLREVAVLGDALASQPGRAAKRALLERAFARATPIETKYLCKALGGGLRIGAQEGVVEGAIGRAFGLSAESLRRAASLVTDPGELAVLAHRGRLGEARLAVGRPVAFMLATPIETLSSPIDPASYVLEDKIDGVRAQAHRSEEGAVALFARGLDRVTEAFPEVAGALAAAEGPVVLDGELIAVGESGRPRPFQSLQARLKKTRPTARDLAGVRVALVAFDLLADRQGSLLERPLLERRARLVDFVASLGTTDAIVLNPASSLPAHEPLDQALDSAFAAARARGHEGLVLKRASSLYEGGKRGQAWVKVKRAHATLDVVVVGAEEGHGRRAGALSDYTFSVWRDGELLTVGKAYSGLTDDEIETMTRRLEAMTFERRGGLRVVRPEIVIEVAFDGVQKSSRHASGFALRFPRIVRVRDDKLPAEADSIAAVEAIFAAQVASGHREPGVASHERKRTTEGRSQQRARTRAKPSRQLSLFGEED